MKIFYLEVWFSLHSLERVYNQQNISLLGKIVHKNFTTSHLVISPKNNYNINDQLVNH